MIYDVEVKVILLDGATPAMADMNPDGVGTHRLVVEADTPVEAEEMALDQFHETVPIGMLEYVSVDASAVARTG